VKRLSTWDTYVQEAAKKGDRSIEIPLTEDEVFIVSYPTRRQGREIVRAQTMADTDALLIAMLGEDAGRRVQELAEDQPAYVLDEFIYDVMRKFGMIPDESDDADGSDDQDEPAKVAPATPPARRPASNGRVNGTTVPPGKSTAATKRKSTSGRSRAASS
jgi:hypothetical protein